MTNPYEIPLFDLSRDARLSALYLAHAHTARCPECGGELELRPSATAVEVVCETCHWHKEVA